MSNQVDVDIHMSRLAGWVLNTIGKALAISMGIAFLVGVIAMATEEPGLLWLAGLAGPLAFAVVLYNADAPMPPE